MSLYCVLREMRVSDVDRQEQNRASASATSRRSVGSCSKKGRGCTDWCFQSSIPWSAGPDCACKLGPECGSPTHPRTEPWILHWMPKFLSMVCTDCLKTMWVVSTYQDILKCCLASLKPILISDVCINIIVVELCIYTLISNIHWFIYIYIYNRRPQ